VVKDLTWWMDEHGEGRKKGREESRYAINELKGGAEGSFVVDVILRRCCERWFRAKEWSARGDTTGDGGRISLNNGRENNRNAKPKKKKEVSPGATALRPRLSKEPALYTRNVQKAEGERKTNTPNFPADEMRHLSQKSRRHPRETVPMFTRPHTKEIHEGEDH